MTCKYCNTQMHERGSKTPSRSTKVFVCPKCGAVLYIYEDEDKWEK